uniref:Uncharacterized protein n=1 Tax=Moniliophthora roreri TaxID=221103 RepID=A0A0W0FZL4_MONRR
MQVCKKLSTVPWKSYLTQLQNDDRARFPGRLIATEKGKRKNAEREAAGAGRGRGSGGVLT